MRPMSCTRDQSATGLLNKARRWQLTVCKVETTTVVAVLDFPVYVHLVRNVRWPRNERCTTSVGGLRAANVCFPSSPYIISDFIFQRLRLG